MYQLVKFNEQKWGVKRKADRYGWEEDAYVQPKYKVGWFSSSRIAGKQEEWSTPSLVMKYCTMSQADARKLCLILNKENQDKLDNEALFNGATVVACDNPVGANSGSN